MGADPVANRRATSASWGCIASAPSPRRPANYRLIGAAARRNLRAASCGRPNEGISAARAGVVPAPPSRRAAVEGLLLVPAGAAPFVTGATDVVEVSQVRRYRLYQLSPGLVQEQLVNGMLFHVEVPDLDVMSRDVVV